MSVAGTWPHRVLEPGSTEISIQMAPMTGMAPSFDMSLPSVSEQRIPAPLQEQMQEEQKSGQGWRFRVGQRG